MPFIQNLGYDVFNPLEVVPEYISDIGIKKGEKIDYAIFQDVASNFRSEYVLNHNNSKLISLSGLKVK